VTMPVTFVLKGAGAETLYHEAVGASE